MLDRIQFLMLSICLIALGDIATGGGMYANADSPGKAAARPAFAKLEISEDVFEFEGRRIVYVEAGAGDAVYLAHGVACDYTDWREQLGSLASDST